MKRIATILITALMALNIGACSPTASRDIRELPNASIAERFPTASQNRVWNEDAAKTPAAIQVVDAAQYASQSMDSLAAPTPGEVLIEYDVWQAVDDPTTDGKYFFVELHICSDIGAAALGAVDQYVYNNKTVADWRTLADLAGEAYPYAEYNGDHGGNVTEEEYNAAVTEAESLDARTNLEAAMQEYNAAYDAAYSDLEKLHLEAIESECARLKSLGYDVKVYETWTYFGAGEKQYAPVLVGLFTKAQLKGLQTDDVNPDIGIALSWVRNGDGIATFDSAEWE